MRKFYLDNIRYLFRVVSYRLLSFFSHGSAKETGKGLHTHACRRYRRRYPLHRFLFRPQLHFARMPAEPSHESVSLDCYTCHSRMRREILQSRDSRHPLFCKSLLRSLHPALSRFARRLLFSALLLSFPGGLELYHRSYPRVRFDFRSI